MYLQEIIKHKREEVATLKTVDIARSRPVLNPLDYLRDRPIIAEIKKASPSRGDISPGADTLGQARLYEEGGAGAISVLTDSRFFKGSYGDLVDISRVVGLPLLCKDFIISEVQIENAFLHGADFILLIAAVLSAQELTRLSARAAGFGMRVLFEVHDIEEVEKIKALDPELVGVNSRDLTSFRINKDKAMNTIRSLKGDFLRVAESGIEISRDIIDFKKAGADVFLVGTALMASADPKARLAEFSAALERPCS
jgi:indole-3-glycerol phosphate synthase